MLYHPAKDLNHCIYRVISILVNLNSPVSLEKLRLLDFYYLFPHLIKEISPWPSDIKDYRRTAFGIADSYEKITDKRRVFFELANAQKSAVITLLSKGILHMESYKKGELVVNNERVPKQILEMTQQDDFHSSDVFEVLVNGLALTTWKGNNGLKKRSGLMEYKYDE